MKIFDLPPRLARLHDRKQPIMVAATLFAVLVCVALIGAYLHSLVVGILVIGLGILGYRLIGQIRMLLQVGEQLSGSEKRLQAITDNLTAFIVYIDRDERFQFTNQAYEKWLGKPSSEIIGHHVGEACGDEVYGKYKRFFDRAVAGRKTDFAFAAMRDGSKRYYHASHIPQFDEDGKVVGVCGVIRDITELKKLELQLIKLARVDALTGLPNRLQFDEHLRKAIGRSRRSGFPLALMYLEIDHLKTINDTYGYQAGDEALCEFASRLSASVRKTDNVSRLSGDEFVTILEGMKTKDEADIVASNVIQAMQAEFSVAGKLYLVTTSIGIAILRDDDIEPQSLLRRAHQALYRAKSGGGNAHSAAENRQPADLAAGERRHDAI
jgi:diguanylate cyclase (GGDEF)-like protein/PAS domain S-box-containing protein